MKTTLRSRPAAVLAACALGLAGCGHGGGGTGGALEVRKVLGEAGNSPGQFVFPRALDADASSLWVIDKTARIQRLDPQTGKAWVCWQTPAHELGKPTGVTVGPGPRGRPALYVPDTHYQRVLVYSAPADVHEEPRELYRFGAFGRGPGQFIYPTDVAVLPAPDGKGPGRLYVSEYGGNDRVSVFGPDHEFLFSFGRPAEGAEVSLPPELRGDNADPPAEGPSFNRPQAIALDAARKRMVITDACDHRLGVFDLDGRLIRWIGSAEQVGSEPGRFNYPYGLALMDDGTVLVSEVGNHRVQRIDPETGAPLGVYGSVGRGPGEFFTPWAVAVRGGEAWVLDSGNNRLESFDSPVARRFAASGVGSGGGGP
ncbi:MAG: hypothetical protein IT437_05610 [Phycisphaerales bacterium]|nr:hypothetical protein [Phycisphaerales bacterium]